MKLFLLIVLSLIISALYLLSGEPLVTAGESGDAAGRSGFIVGSVISYGLAPAAVGAGLSGLKFGIQRMLGKPTRFLRDWYWMWAILGILTLLAVVAKFASS